MPQWTFQIDQRNSPFCYRICHRKKQGLGWAQLEKYVRFWAKAKGELYVYTGVIYKNKTPRTFVGTGRVAVPD